MKLALPSYTVYSNSLPSIPDFLWASPRASRGSAIDVFLVEMIMACDNCAELWNSSYSNSSYH